MTFQLTARLCRRPIVKKWLENLTPTSRLIWPLFVHPAAKPKTAVRGFPGVFRFSPTAATTRACDFYRNGGRAVLLFGLPRRQDTAGSEAWSTDSAVTRTIRAIKKKCPRLVVITDVCLCAYTTRGSCEILNIAGKIDLEKTLDSLNRIAINHARAGADFVAPSGMTAGRVTALRHALDTAGFRETAIFDYAAKFRSTLYGPFRAAAGSTPKKEIQRNSQIDPIDHQRALAEIRRSQKDGVDIVMVKPALPYLNVVTAAKKICRRPVAAFQTSGEYVALHKKSPRTIVTSLTKIHRAGADLIITYFANDFVDNNPQL